MKAEVYWGTPVCVVLGNLGLDLVLVPAGPMALQLGMPMESHLLLTGANPSLA